MPLLRFLRFNLIPAAWGALIILLTSLPGTVIPEIPRFLDLLNPDKVLHLLVFAIFVFLQGKALKKQDVFPGLQLHACWIALVPGFVLGTGTEMLQSFVIPMRIGSVYDFAANMAGCGVGYWSCRKWS